MASPDLDPRFMATVRAMLSTPASKVPPPGKKPAMKAAAKKTKKK